MIIGRRQTVRGLARLGARWISSKAVCPVVGVALMVLWAGCGTGAVGPGPDRTGAGIGGRSKQALTLKAPEIGLMAGEGEFAWRQTGGPTVELDASDPRNPTFVPLELDEETEYEFVVGIKADGVTSQYKVSAIVPPSGLCLGNRPPVAVAANDFKIARVGEAVVLNAGNSTDPDFDELSYSWTQADLATGGFPGAAGQVQLFLAESAGPSFLAAEAGNLLFTVFVSDGCYTVSHTMAVAVLPTGGVCSEVVCLPGSACDPSTGGCAGEDRCARVRCSLGQTCDPTTGSCVDSLGCMTDADCDDGDPCTKDSCGQDTCMSVFLDTDGDGLGNMCDDDDDGDGFRDDDDPFPLDSAVPGSFSTPNSILENDIVRAALAEFRSRGFSFEPSILLDPPGTAGKYRFETGDGSFIATGNGRDEGKLLCGREFTIEVGSDQLAEFSGRTLCGQETPGSALESRTSFAFVRGEGQHFTIYQTGTSWCDSDPGAYKSFVGIQTARVDATTGDWLDRLSLTVTVATSRRQETRFCADQVSAGDTEDVGGWDATLTPKINRIGFGGVACSFDQDCDDGDPCTTDSCDQRACRNEPIACEDGTTCQSGVCQVDPACARPLLFSAEELASNGDNASGIQIEDFDLDGNNDLVVANATLGRRGGTRNVAILFATGEGAFGPPRVFGGFSRPRSIVNGDIDRDGWPDLAVSDFDSDRVAVLFGSSTGVLDGTRTLDLAVGDGPRELALVDLDNDGWPDLAVTHSGDGNVFVFLNDGTGGFNTPSVVDVRSKPRSIASGDFDEDGCMDLVVTSNGSNSMSLLLGFCDGTFASQISIPVARASRRVVAGDFDANGTRDLAVATWRRGNASSSDVLMILFGDGQGTFPTQQTIATGSVSGLAVGDIDGDGAVDIAAVSAGAVRVILSNRDGSFNVQTVQAGNSPNKIALGDLDGDQDIDIAVSNFTKPGSITLLMNRCGE